MTAKIAAPDSAAPVTMLELFFDLVFVFLLTQLTSLLTSSHGWLGYGRAALVLVINWWMYDGFAWLANNVPPFTTATRLPMLLAMTCFLAMASVVPEVFGAGAWLFAVAYLVVVSVHAVQFSRSSQGESAQAIRRIVPVNYVVAALLLLAAGLGPRWGWLSWIIAVLVLVSTVAGRRNTTFALRAEHFAERHGLLIIIALGETLIAVGAGAQGQLTHLAVAGCAALAMVVISALWWIYFAVGDDIRAVPAIEDAALQRRTPLASRAYSYAHLLHVAGLILLAAGLRTVIRSPTLPLDTALAVSLSAGVALFLLGQAAFRTILRIGPAAAHLSVALLSVAVVPLGVLTAGVVQLGLIAVVLVSLAAVLQLKRLPRRAYE